MSVATSQTLDQEFTSGLRIRLTECLPGQKEARSASCSVASESGERYLRCAVIWMDSRAGVPVLGLVCAPEAVKEGSCAAESVTAAILWAIQWRVSIIPR